ncbi:MAG: hypothetical protein J5U19_07605 [Candidatus Methanoperedens sp.]|nr:hypothetical protein [Candidatus Methanoperedens sp.]
MSLKRFFDEESGITYTMEAILGVLLIIGTIIYMTGNLPYSAQKTADYSRVQLMNTGRDNLDLMAIDIGEKCINETYLKEYKSNYSAAFVNYNFYLISPNGSIFKNCPEFNNGQLINGYPTEDAVTVNKLVHINDSENTAHILELRMVLWYN